MYHRRHEWETCTQRNPVRTREAVKQSEILPRGSLTPAQQVIPDEILFFRKHRHHDESVQVDALAQHPEVVAAQQVQVDEHEQLAAGLGERERDAGDFTDDGDFFERPTFSSGGSLTESLYVCPSFFTTVVSQTTVVTEFSANERKRFLWSVIL